MKKFFSRFKVAIPVPQFKRVPKEIEIPYPITFKHVPKEIEIPKLEIHQPGILKSIVEQPGGFILFVLFSLIGLAWLIGTYL